MAGGTHVFDMMRRVNENRKLALVRRLRRTESSQAFHPHLRASDPLIVRLIRRGLNVVFVLSFVAVLVWMVAAFW